MDAEKLLVLEDAVREVFGDDSDIVLWLQHPEAVRHLIRGIPSLRVTDICGDPDCHCFLHEQAHTRLCKTAAALRALNDPRALVDMDRAYEEALAIDGGYERHVVMQYDPRPPHPLEHGDYNG